MYKNLVAFLLFFAATTAVCDQPHPPRTFRNPFQPVASPTPAPRTGDRPPLEQHPLNALKLTAIITNAAGELFASVETPEGIGFKVVKGTVVGVEGSRVVEISKKGIVIDERGSDRKSLREIPLHSKD